MRNSLLKLLWNLKIVFGKKGFYSYPTDRQKELYQQANEGDVFFCIMPKTYSQLNEIREGHRHRPYLILKKEKNYFYGVPATSNPLTKYSYYQKFAYFDENDTSQKEGMFNLKSVEKVPLCCIQIPHRTISKRALSRIIKRLWIGSQLNGSKLYKGFQKPGYEPYDLIEVNKNWYMITKVSKDYIEGIHASKIRPKSKKAGFVVQGLSYRVQLNPKPLKKFLVQDYPVLGFFTLSQISQIEGMFREEERVHQEEPKKNCAQSKIFFEKPIGTVIEDRITNNQYIYLYSKRKKHKKQKIMYPYYVENEEMILKYKPSAHKILNPNIMGQLDYNEILEILSEFEDDNMDEIKQRLMDDFNNQANKVASVPENRYSFQLSLSI